MVWLIPENIRSRSDVLPPFQTLARDFADLITEEEAVLWFEPLLELNGDRPDFVFLDPSIGVVVLEIFPGHQGAQGGVLGAVRRVLRIDLEGEEHEVDNPLERADRFMDLLRTRFRELDETRHVPIGSVAVFSDVERHEAEELRIGEVVDLDRCIFKSHLDRNRPEQSRAALEEIFRNSMSEPLQERLDQQTVDWVRGVIHPGTVLRPRLLPDHSDDQTIAVMDLKQEQYGRTLRGGHRVILGVAGSGKTVVIVTRAQHLASHFPNLRILVTCKTRALVSSLKAQVGEWPNVRVVHIDKIMRDVMHSAGRECSDPNFDDEWAREAKVALGEVPQFRYDAVLVDEAQNFSTEYLKFCVALFQDPDPARHSLLVVGDPAQDIYANGFTWIAAGIHAQGRTKRLRINYRNTRQTLSFAWKFLIQDPEIDIGVTSDGDSDVVEPQSAGREGHEPEVHAVSGVAEEIGKIQEIIEGWYYNGIPSRSIGVLYWDTRRHRRQDWEQVASVLAEWGVLWVTDPANYGNRDRAGVASEPVILSAIDSAQGQDYTNVIVCGLPGPREIDTAERKRIYSGFTRATHDLAVVVQVDSSIIDDVQEAQT